MLGKHHSLITNHRTCLLLGVLVTGLLVVLAIFYRLPTIGYYWYQMDYVTTETRAKSMWLPNYEAVVQAKVIEGINDNLSGITYNSDTHTLFAITNSPSQLIELSRDGEVLRIIDIENGSDTEDITYLGNQQFLLVGEKSNLLYRISIDGIEAVFWDASSGRLLLGQEKHPVLLTDASSSGVSTTTGGMFSRLFIRDLSAITLYHPTASKLLLSDESALVVEYSADGRVVSMLPLWHGFQGLKRTIPRPEGMVVTPNGDLFIVSEPNLFYRYENFSPSALTAITTDAAVPQG